MNLPIFYVDDLIKRAITEDINYIDVTSDYLLDDDDMSQAYWVSKDSGVIAGLDIGLRVFTLLDPSIRLETKVKDGDRVEKGDILATIEGPTKSLLKGERTALNLVQHMSGIATAGAWIWWPAPKPPLPAPGKPSPACGLFRNTPLSAVADGITATTSATPPC